MGWGLSPRDKLGAMLRPGGKHYGWSLVGMFAVNYSMVVIAFETLGFLLPGMAEDLDLSLTEQGWLSSSIMFTNLIFEVPSNWFFSRFRPWRSSVVSFFTAAGFVALKGFAPTLLVLFIARIGLGMIYLSTQASRTILLIHWIPSRQLGKANGIMFSVLETTIGLGFMLIPAILWLADGDWRRTLFIWAIVSAVGAFVWLLWGRDRPRDEMPQSSETSGDTPIRVIWRYKEPWILGFGVAGITGARSAFATFWPTYLDESYGIALVTVGLILGIAGLTKGPMILGVTLVSAIASRTPWLLMACGLVMAASSFGMVLSDSVGLLFLSGIINGMTMCFIPAMITTIYRLPGIQEREVAVAVAIFFSCLWTGSALGPTFTGIIGDATDLRTGLLIAALFPLTLSTAGIVLRLTGPRTPEPALTTP